MGVLYTLRSGGTAHPEDSFLQFFTDCIIQAGVKDLNTTDNHFKVTQNSPAGMSVLVNTGRALVQRGSSNLYPVRHTTSPTTITIDNNASGNPRIDAIVLYINLGASPNTDSSNVATLTKVNGTPAASPIPPTDSEIATAIGASNPFIRLANVTVANGAVQILDADISDQRKEFKIKVTNTATPTFTIVGTLVLGSNLTPLIVSPTNLIIKKAFARVKTAPAGADLIIDINKNGTSIWNTNQTNRLKITAGGLSGSQTTFDTTSLSEGDYLSIDIDQVGSTTAGADLTVELYCEGA